MKKIVLFDLDGTLTDSSEGILNSIRYMLEKKGLAISDTETLRSFIGPPLADSLKALYGISEAEAQEAVESYREYYADQGIKQLTVYPGVEKMLTDLSVDYSLAIATSKPEFFAEQVIENTGLTKYFTGIFGADLAGDRSKKADVITYALEQLEGDTAVMVGDRKFDILGAKDNQLKSIGVLYGFGDRQELAEAGADLLVEKALEIPLALQRLF
ncbi:HAD-IA family hydrolase [Enterococcus gilvus]|uniref:HAD-IA family hydrolase n=1 Tax=Enterococcus gilvus TaxID=160453 RepID=UPI00345E8820